MSLNYVMLGSNDVPKARGFFDAVLPIIGGRMIAEYMPHAVCYELRGGGRIWVATPFNEEVATPGNGNMGTPDWSHTARRASYASGSVLPTSPHCSTIATGEVVWRDHTRRRWQSPASQQGPTQQCCYWVLVSPTPNSNQPTPTRVRFAALESFPISLMRFHPCWIEV